MRALFNKKLDGFWQWLQKRKFFPNSFGFSDDDQKNVKAAEDFIRNELTITYPEIHFVIYDTSDKETKKMLSMGGALTLKTVK
jgi:hypothetical protein